MGVAVAVVGGASLSVGVVVGVELLQELAADRDVEPAQLGGERFDVVTTGRAPRGVGRRYF